MRLLGIEINNLFSIGHIEHSLDNLGLVMVNGYSKDEGSANGSGKSSFARNAILWGLFGKTLSDTSGDDVINRHSGTKNAYVEISLEAKGQIYEILRGRNPNRLSIHRNGVDITPKQNVQLTIDQILGTNFQAAIHTDFFGQGRKEGFMFLTPTLQKELIQEVLQFQEVDTWIDNAKALKSSSALEIALQQKDGLSIEEKIRFLDIPALESKRAKWDEDNDRLQIQERILELEKSVVKIKEVMARIQSQSEISKEAKLHIEYNEFTKQVSDAQAQMGALDSEYANLIAIAEEHVVAYMDDPSKPRCPTCKQHLSHEKYDEMKERHAKVRAQLEAKYQEKQYVSGVYSNYMAELRTYTNRFRAIEQAKEEIRRFNNSVNLYEQEAIEKREMLKRLVNPYNEILVKARSQLSLLQEERQKLYKTATVMGEELQTLTNWHEMFSKDFRVFLLERACPFLERQTNYYLKLLNNDQISVSFSTSKELKSGDLKYEFNVEVISKTGAKKFSLLSGGEQQMVSFAVGLALADLAQQKSNASNFMVLDEPFTNLDPKNCENVVNFINQHLRNKKDTILFISNEENLRGLIPSRIYIEKEKGISSLVGG